MAQASSNFLHNLFAGNSNTNSSNGNSTTADYVINLNLPDWKSQTQPQPVKKGFEWTPLHTLAGLTILFLAGILILKSRQSKTA